MVSQKLIVSNSEGLHMRPAGVLAKEMSKFNSSITIIYDGTKYDGKSIMSIMAACIKCGSEIEIVCSGSDEEAALIKAISLVQ